MPSTPHHRPALATTSLSTQHSIALKSFLLTSSAVYGRRNRYLSHDTVRSNDTVTTRTAKVTVETLSGGRLVKIVVVLSHGRAGERIKIAKEVGATTLSARGKIDRGGVDLGATLQHVVEGGRDIGKGTVAEGIIEGTSDESVRVEVAGVRVEVAGVERGEAISTEGIGVEAIGKVGGVEVICVEATAAEATSTEGVGAEAIGEASSVGVIRVEATNVEVTNVERLGVEAGAAEAVIIGAVGIDNVEAVGVVQRLKVRECVADVSVGRILVVVRQKRGDVRVAQLVGVLRCVDILEVTVGEGGVLRGHICSWT